MNDEILQNIWNQLTSDGMTDSDFGIWKSNFAGSEEIQTKVHAYLYKNGHTNSNIEAWSTNVGLKKKDNSELTSPEGVLGLNTDGVQIPGSTDGSEVIDEQIIEETPAGVEDEGFDETILENQNKLLKNQNNLDILNSIGFFDSKKPQMETFEEAKLLTSKEGGPERRYQIKDLETGQFSSKKESEIPENILNAIKLYEKANPDVVKKEEVLLTKEDYNNSDTISSEILAENNVSQEDYLKWEKKNTRQEGSVYKFFKTLLPSDEGNQYELEKRQYEKIQSYNASRLNAVTNKLSVNAAAQQLSVNPEEIRRLKQEAKVIQNEFMNVYSSLETAIDSFPTYKDKSVDDDLKKRKDLYNAVNAGGVSEISAGTIELVKTIGTAITSFSTDVMAGLPGFFDQRLSNIGFKKKGFLAGLSSAIKDSGDHLEMDLGETKRPAFQSGKPVMFEGKEFIVDENGTVYDKNSNIRMDGIISDDKIKTIIKRSKDVPKSEINWTGGSLTTNGVSTLVNLYALIRAGGKFNNATGLSKFVKPATAGKIGMGVASFTSGVVNNVEDIRSQLMATGMSENEAMDIAVNAGQAISTLDAVFSGLAGSNTQLLTGFQAIKDEVKNLAIKGGKKFTKKQLIDKGYALAKENAKELFVEELPVYFSEKAINNLVNQKIGNEVLDQKVTWAGVIETGVMTIGATSFLGSTNLLRGNKRKDLVRTLAKDVQDLKKTLDVLVKEGSLTKQEAANAYNEIYNMQSAELKTKGTIKISENVEEAADLLTQRQNLMFQKEGLEGPLKEDIDSRIEDVDAQIKKLQQRDLAQAQAIVDGEKDGERTVEVTKEEAADALKEENQVRLKAGLPAILESKTNIIKKQDELIKDKQDAIQESSTESVDVRQQARDGKKVVERDATGAVTNQTTQENKSQTENKETEIVARERIEQPIRVPKTSMDVNLNPDGSVKSIVKKGTKKSATKVGIKKAGKFILTDVIDVNDGKKAEIPEGVNSPEEVTDIIANKSDNVKEVASAIESEKKRFEEEKNDRNQMTDEGGINEIIGMKFTAESWEQKTGNKPSEDGVSSRWISNKGKSIEDGWVDETTGLTLKKVTDFIKQYPTTEAIKNYQKGDFEISNSIEKLKERFKKLTGLEATDANIGTVMSIDPNREPINVTKEKARTQASKDSTDPNVPDFGKKKGPSAKKILGIEDKKKIEVDEVKGLKDVLRREIKRAKDLLLDQSKRREALATTIKMLADIGNITTKKAAALAKAISGVNVNNASAVLRVTNYVEKVFQNAANVKKLSTANNIKKRINKILNSKKIEANVEASVEQFLRISPELVNDLDLYLEKLSDVFYKLKPTKAQISGIQSDLDGIELINEPDAKIKKFNKRASVNPQAVNINDLDSYSNTALEEQKEKLFDAEKQIFEDLTGLDSKEFNLEEMREMLTSLKPDETPDFENLKIKPGAVKEAVIKAFDKFGALVQGEIDNDTDPLTGEESKMSKEDKVLLQSFLDMDLNSLNPEQQMRALDALVNYATNKTNGGMKRMIKNYEGITKADALSKVKGFVAKKLKFAVGGKLGAEFWASQLSTINSVFESIFVGQGKALRAEQASGFTELKNGAANATKLANDIIDTYSKKFIASEGRFSDGIKNVFKSKAKPKPNGELFESLYNDIERGLFSFMRRTKIGTEIEQKNEFNRRKKLIEDSIKILEKGDSSQQRLAEAYQKAFDKVAKDSETINDLESKVDPINVEAVDFITQEWAKNREALDDVSLNIYNKILGTDLNYTTDVYTKVGETESEVDLGESVFQGQQKTIYDKKTGVLMEATRPNSLPKNSIIDLGFDIAQTRSLEKALTDIYTAPAIQQIKGFVNSEGFKKLIPNENDRNLLKDRIKNFVNLKRKINPEFDQVAGVNVQKVKNLVDYVASLGVSRALGSIVQFPKQLVPLIATAWNAGGKFTAMGVNLLRRSEVQEFLNNSGYAIANRGVANITTLDGTNKKLERAADGNMSKIARAIGSLNQTWLQSLLVKPDKIAARGSWIAFYMKDIKKQGLDPGNIEWDVKKLNKQAADYAQQQVDRQQNTSDADLQGRFFTSKALGQSVARKALFAFSNFLINQKTRMYNDIGVLSSKLGNRGDKTSAIKSLAGLMTETLTFNAMGYALGQAVSEMFFGDDEDEEDKEKTRQNRIKGRTGNVVKDLLSPIPLTDPLVIKGVNKLISITSGSDKPFQFFTNDRRTFNESMGVLGIPVENAEVLFEMVEIGLSGTYNVEFMGSLTKKKLTPEDQDRLYFLFTSYLMYSTGMVPADVGPIIKKKLKLLKKGSADKIKQEKKNVYTLPKKKSTTRKKQRNTSAGPSPAFSNKKNNKMPQSPF